MQSMMTLYQRHIEYIVKLNRSQSLLTMYQTYWQQYETELTPRSPYHPPSTKAGSRQASEAFPDPFDIPVRSRAE